MSGIKGVDIVEIVAIPTLVAGVWLRFGTAWALMSVGAIMLLAAVVYRIFRSPADAGKTD